MMNCYNCNHPNREQAHFCVKCGSPLTLNNRYRVTRVIARGGMGTVYLGQDMQRNLRVAIKAHELRGLTPSDQHALEMQIRQDVALFALLRHPVIPQTIESFSDARAVYVVMEFVEGESLETVLQKKDAPFSEIETIGYVSQVCDALRYLHAQRPPVIHRDLKPSNIYRTSTGQIRLIGFAGAPKINETDKTWIQVTPGFSSLEQYSGMSDARSDIYSLGATLYNLLTNQIPADVTELATRQQMLVPVRHLNPRISPAFGNVILKAMALKPEDRFQRVDEFCAAITSLAQAPFPASPVFAPSVLSPNYASPQAMPPPAAMPAFGGAPGANTGALAPDTLTRYCRTEYFSPMDLGVAYDLRVAILLERHGKGIFQNAKVDFARLNFQPQEAEPLVRIVPYSSYLNISPSFRDLKIMAQRDVSADFKITAPQMPPQGRADLQIDIEYAGERVRRISLPVQVQHQFKMGPLKIPHSYWHRVSLAGATVLSIDSAFGAYNLATQAIPSLSVFLFPPIFVVALAILILGVLLWKRAGKRLVVMS